MRKIAGLFSILALTFGLMPGVAAAQQLRTVKPTNHGSPVPPGSIKRLSPDNHSLVKFKAQNNLGSALNQILYKDRSGAGGTVSDPGIKNGTADTIPYFNSWFITGSRNSIYPYSMAGHSPAAGGTTGINNTVISLGTFLCPPGDGYSCLGAPFVPTVPPPSYVFDPNLANDPQGTDVALAVQSPIYDATTTYPGPPADTGQVIDTAQRTEFSSERTADWHTPLNAPTVNPNPGGGSIQFYQVLSYDNGDWACIGGSIPAPTCAPGDFPVVNINSISNNFQFLLTFFAQPNNTVPIILTDFITAFDPSSGACCVLGFHSAQPGIVNPAGVTVWTWATFIPQSNNPFAPFGNDVMVLSHELSELYNDPFINTNVAPWVDGSVSFAQGNLETGDTIEAMAAVDVIYNVPLTTTGGLYNYDLQNVALLQWFERNPFSSGPYSWPNEGSLSHNPHPANFNALGSTSACSASPSSCWFYGEGSAGFFFGPPF